MRSIDRYRKRYQKAEKHDKSENNKLEETNPNSLFKKLPITLYDTGGEETDIERFERFNRQLVRCISACSLCDNGLKEFKFNEEIRDPQFQQSIWHKNIMLIKWAPDGSDIRGLFHYNWLIDLLNKNNLELSNFYKTSIIKCPEINDKNASCPFFDLEIKSMKNNNCYPKIIIAFDNDSLKKLGVKIDKPIVKLNSTIYYRTTGENDKNLSKFIARLKHLINGI